MFCFFFFSSRRRHTRCLSDWSSDVCSSDLPRAREHRRQATDHVLAPAVRFDLQPEAPEVARVDAMDRSEERRVGKECRSGWSPYHSKHTTTQETGLAETASEEECGRRRIDG